MEDLGIQLGVIVSFSFCGIFFHFYPIKDTDTP